MTYLQLFLILFTVSHSIVYLTAQYRAIPQPGIRLDVALKRSFELKCEYLGTGDGQFAEWFKKNATHDVSVNTDKPGHYNVKNTEKESTLKIKIFVNADANITRWYVKTNKHGYEEYPCEFGQISLIASPQAIIDDKNKILDSAHGSVRRSEDQHINLKCLIEPANAYRENQIKWEYSKDDKIFTHLPDGIDMKNNEIDIKSVKKSHRGFYRCTLNDVSFTVLLRVKDRLAALWPFIGIVCIVLILVIIILIFEKQQKSNKKSVTTDDDEHDHASDPLVRTTIKASDNDNKKRAVKA